MSSFRRYVRTQQLGRPTVRNPTVMDSQRLYDSVSVEVIFSILQ